MGYGLIIIGVVTLFAFAVLYSRERDSFTEEVEAECMDFIQKDSVTKHSKIQTSFYRFLNRVNKTENTLDETRTVFDIFYQYTYGGRQYSYVEKNSKKTPIKGEKAVIRISPMNPDKKMTGNLPQLALAGGLFLLAGLLNLVSGFFFKG